MVKDNGSHKYDDMIDLPHHQSTRRPHMPLSERAAQFSPFAALTGYEAAITEAGRLTESFREMDESEKQLLDEMLWFLEENRANAPEIAVLHFVPDERKEGGSYVETSGRYLKVDRATKEIVLVGGERISMDGILRIRLVAKGE